MNTTTPNAAAAGTVTLGDLTVHRLGFGAMRITGKGIWGPPRDRDEAIRVLRRAVELGVEFIDTADSYGPYVSEELIAEALHPYPTGVVIATKAGFERSGPDAWSPNTQPQHLREAVEGSLRRLRLDTIDLLQLHNVGSTVPYEEAVGELSKLQGEGKIRHVGLSNVGMEHIERATKIVPIVSVQNRYNVASGDGTFIGVNDEETVRVLAYCEERDLAFLPWAPLAGGSLDHGAFETLARAHGVTPNAVALAWLLRRSPAMLPIPGTSSVSHLEENVAAAALKLTDEEFETLSS